MTDTPHKRALMKLYDLSANQRIDWMHFHEVAIRDPFEAEREALAFCRAVAEIVSEAGVTAGFQWGGRDA